MVPLLGHIPSILSENILPEDEKNKTHQCNPQFIKKWIKDKCSHDFSM